MKKKEMPYEDLQQYVGPCGPGSKKPVYGTSPRDEVLIEVGDVLDTEAPLFKAMWETCLMCAANKAYTNFSFHILRDDRRCAGGYVPRSRAEAALLLPEIAVDIFGSVRVEFNHDSGKWDAKVGVSAADGDHPLDALCVALLAALKVKEVANA